MSLTGHGLGVIQGLALHAVGVALVGFDDEQLSRRGLSITPEMRGVSGSVVLKVRGGKGGFKAVAGERLPFIERAIVSVWSPLVTTVVSRRVSTAL